MKIFRKFHLLLYFVLPQFVPGSNGIRRQQKSATEKCGNPGDDIQVRIVGGDAYERGDFPWMVALTRILSNKAPVFHGAGTLVSSRHVVTGNNQSQILWFLVIRVLKYFVRFHVAAHCIKAKRDHLELLPHSLIALFGVHNLNDPYEVDRIALSPEYLKVHPDWNSSDTRHDADIAIMTFASDAIPSSQFIQPICLWNGDTPPSQTEGHVAGWGNNRKSRNLYEVIPAKLKVPIHTNEDCFLTTKNLVDLASNRTFCAGRGDGSGVCNGDSRGGVSIKVGSVFYFRGIVSSGLRDQMNCDVTKYSIFTDVLKFKPWIDQIMREDDGISVANLTCTIQQGTWSNSLRNEQISKFVPTCFIEKQKIDGEGFSVAADNSYQSIQGFSIEDNKEVKFLPENIVELFSELIVYEVYNCSIRTVNGKHFKGLTKLESLNLAYNEIEPMDEDSFKDLTKLWELRIGDNQIKHLDVQIFDNLKNLKYVSLQNNKLLTIPANLFKNNLKLAGIFLDGNQIQTISSRMFDHLKKLNYVDLRYNFCANDYYFKNQFDEMKNIISTNCLPSVYNKGRKFFTDSVNYRIYRSFSKSVITEIGISN